MCSSTSDGMPFSCRRPVGDLAKKGVVESKLILPSDTVVVLRPSLGALVPKSQRLGSTLGVADCGRQSPFHGFYSSAHPHPIKALISINNTPISVPFSITAHTWEKATSVSPCHSTPILFRSSSCTPLQTWVRPCRTASAQGFHPPVSEAIRLTRFYRSQKEPKNVPRDLLTR